MKSSKDKGWWAVVVRISSAIKGEGASTIVEYSLRLIEALSLEEAKEKARRAAIASNPDGRTTDRKVTQHSVKSIVGAEYLGARPPQDGDEVWSRLAFLDREEDRPTSMDAPPFWASRAFHTDWNVATPEERW